MWISWFWSVWNGSSRSRTWLTFTRMFCRCRIRRAISSWNHIYIVVHIYKVWGVVYGKSPFGVVFTAAPKMYVLWHLAYTDNVESPPHGVFHGRGLHGQPKHADYSLYKCDAHAPCNCFNNV